MKLKAAEITLGNRVAPDWVMFFVYLANRQYSREAYFGLMDQVLRMTLAHHKT